MAQMFSYMHNNTIWLTFSISVSGRCNLTLQIYRELIPSYLVMCNVMFVVFEFQDVLLFLTVSCIHMMTTE